jgi:hypothetical protein
LVALPLEPSTDAAADFTREEAEDAEPQRIAAEAWQAEEFWKAQPDMNTRVRFNVETGDVISVKPAPFYANNPAVIAALHGACAMVVTVT